MRTCAFILLALTLAGCGQSDPLAYSKSQLAYQQAQYDAQQAQARAEALEPVQRAAVAAWWLFLAALPLTLMIAGIDAYRQRRRPLVRPDHAGQLPVPRAMIDSGELAGAMVEALAAYHRTQQLAAQRPMIDKLSITVKEPSAHIPPGAPSFLLSEPEPAALPTGTVDLAELVRDWRPSVQSITLAVGPGGVPYRVHAKDLCHVALAGATGGGKSNIMRLMVAQLLAAGAQVCFADPHFAPLDVDSGDDWRPIAQRLHMAPAVNAADIQHLLAWLASDELPRRLERRYQGQPVGGPLFLAMDELPAIVTDVKDAPEHMSRLLREGRKAGLFLVSSAQDWLVKSIGGAGAVRDCYRTAFYVGGDAHTARVLLDVRGAVDDGQLGQGLAYLRSRVTPTAQLVRVPYASNQAVARLLGGYSETTPQDSSLVLDMPPSSQPVASQDAASSALHSATPVSAESARAASLFLAGRTPAEIVAELRGIKSSQGARYQQALTEVLELVRAGVGPKAAGL